MRPTEAAALLLALQGCGGPSGPQPTDPTTSEPTVDTDTDTQCADEDGDGVCDPDDVCPDADDTADRDSDGLPDGCDSCPDGPAGQITLPLGLLPADLVVAVDNSSGMQLEAQQVQLNLNALNSQLFVAGLDPRVVLISAGSTIPEGICVPPALGSGNCPDDSLPPTYLHVLDAVASDNALDQILDHHVEWGASSRPEALTHLLVVSDDDAGLLAADFHARFLALDPDLAGYTFHAIASPEEPITACVAGTICCPAFVPLSAGLGQQYIDLTALTGGVFGNLCTQDFAPIFDQIAQSVIAIAPRRCSWPMPSPPSGWSFDPGALNVAIRDGGTSEAVPWVQDAQACNGPGWFYDDPVAPGGLELCPESCSATAGMPDAELELSFGCLTE